MCLDVEHESRQTIDEVGGVVGGGVTNLLRSPAACDLVAADKTCHVLHDYTYRLHSLITFADCPHISHPALSLSSSLIKKRRFFFLQNFHFVKAYLLAEHLEHLKFKTKSILDESYWSCPTSREQKRNVQYERVEFAPSDSKGIAACIEESSRRLDLSGKTGFISHPRLTAHNVAGSNPSWPIDFCLDFSSTVVELGSGESSADSTNCSPRNTKIIARTRVRRKVKSVLVVV